MVFSRLRITRRVVLPSIFFLISVWLCYTTVISVLHRQDVTEVQEDISWQNMTEVTVYPFVLETLRALVADRNAKAVEKVKSITGSKSFRYVIVVQIHDRVTYLKALLESLAATQNVSDALVILSHDVIDEEIDHLVPAFSSSFEIVQIYFPHSIQLYPNEFPGSSIQDCPDRVGKPEATRRRCLNHDHPDTYGNYRTPKLTQVKHHWWWKFYFVFTHVGLVQKGNIPVILAEEDHYFLPDALVVFDELRSVRETACNPRCAVISIAHHKTKLAEGPESYKKYFAGQWVGSRDNIGIIFDYEQFKSVHQCADTFCDTDDYNWDWTLHFVITKCLKKEYNMIIPMAPRVLHIGDCGGIHHKTACDPEKNVKKAKDFVEELKKDSLFPSKLIRSSSALLKPRDAKVNGGWGDPRDRELCKNISSSLYGKKV